jgi:hypothetical protein
MSIRPATLAMIAMLLGCTACTCGAPPRSAAEQFDLDLAWAPHDGLCDYMRRCCSDADRSDARPAVAAAATDACQTESDHAASTHSSRRDDRLNVAITRGRVHFHAERIAACLAAARSALRVPSTCDGPTPTGRHPDWRIDALTECRGIFEGTVLTDGPCHLAEECASGWCNDNGRCRPRSGAGGTCAPDGDWCEIGLACIDGHCIARATDGQACAASVPDDSCVEGLRCRVTDDGARCTPPAPSGAACTIPDDCASLVCEGGHCVAACGSGS